MIRIITSTFAVLWSPDSDPAPAPLVLMGHPGGLHKKTPGLVARAAYLVTTFGFNAASIDSPGHGDRKRSAADAAWVDDMQRASAGVDPAPCRFERVRVVVCALGEVALKQPDGLAVDDVDRRQQDHARSRMARARSSPAHRITTSRSWT